MAPTNSMSYSEVEPFYPLSLALQRRPHVLPRPRRRCGGPQPPALQRSFRRRLATFAAKFVLALQLGAAVWAPVSAKVLRGAATQVPWAPPHNGSNATNDGTVTANITSDVVWVSPGSVTPAAQASAAFGSAIAGIRTPSSAGTSAATADSAALGREADAEASAARSRAVATRGSAADAGGGSAAVRGKAIWNDTEPTVRTQHIRVGPDTFAEVNDSSQEDRDWIDYLRAHGLANRSTSTAASSEYSWRPELWGPGWLQDGSLLSPPTVDLAALAPALTEDPEYDAKVKTAQETGTLRPALYEGEQPGRPLYGAFNTTYVSGR
eukprot:TRINITY_DN2452_c0_g1_i4.p1 TRINITY_DN2452_c0_g1~~TRINITY_DN2452_c0_g1_i4.p1  ORF type:complete len:332 (+),score=55.03 TRINITY_DN2452_c0_g1_i4:28-996(+)